MRYQGTTAPPHATAPGVGLLVANLGTPDAPTPKALRRYLREFLWDPRIIEQPRLKWWLILNLFILTTRPRASAALYRKIWTPEGSPLLVGTERLAEAVGDYVGGRFDGRLEVAVGMRYGNPSLASALGGLAEAGCRRILLLPLYPQYSATSSASTFDALAAELTRWRWVPELRTVLSYHDRPAYVDALAASFDEAWSSNGRPERFLMSFHGIPLSYFLAGDPYYCHCQKTARLVAERLGLESGRYLVTFQSLFGREEWLKPYTDATVTELGRQGLGRLDVACPGFAVDCLETIEEIDQLNRELFTGAGGGEFNYLPALNLRGDHVAMLGELALENLAGWEGAAEAEAVETTLARAEQAAERYPSAAVRG